eukprot:sb/3479161/
MRSVSVNILVNMVSTVTCYLLIFHPLGQLNLHLKQEPTETSKQPIRTRFLGHVTGYQPIRDQSFLIQSVAVEARRPLGGQTSGAPCRAGHQPRSS